MLTGGQTHVTRKKTQQKKNKHFGKLIIEGDTNLCLLTSRVVDECWITSCRAKSLWPLLLNLFTPLSPRDPIWWICSSLQNRSTLAKDYCYRWRHLSNLAALSFFRACCPDSLFVCAFCCTFVDEFCDRFGTPLCTYIISMWWQRLVSVWLPKVSGLLCKRALQSHFVC